MPAAAATFTGGRPVVVLPSESSTIADGDFLPAVPFPLSCVIDWSAAQDHQEEVKPKSGGWSKSLIIFKRALDVTLTDRGKKIKPHFDGPELSAATREAVRDEFYKSYMADNVDTKRQTFNRCEKEAIT